MFKPLAFCIGWRYIRAQRKTHFISFISLASMLGIALGVAVLITVLSVMNGFDDQIHQRFFGIAHHVSISTFDGQLKNWDSFAKELDKVDGVVSTAPYIGGQGLASAYGQNVPIIISGVLPKNENQVSALGKKMTAGNLDDLKTGKFGIVLGKGVASRLGLNVGEHITLMIPRSTVSPAGVQPRFKRFKIVGIFSAGPGFGFDSRLVYINLHDAQKLFMLGKNVTGIRLKLKNIYDAPVISQKLIQSLPPAYQISNWTNQFGAFFSAIKMEKTMMFMILLLIIAVAVFNLVSSLVMLVNDKRSDIAILRTYGALPRTILGIFISQGMLVGGIGVLIGLVGGILLALNVTAITNKLQDLLHIHLISSNVYFVDYLPSRLALPDLFNICAVAILLCLIATLYPAWRASRIQPAEALRYE